MQRKKRRRNFETHQITLFGMKESNWLDTSKHTKVCNVENDKKNRFHELYCNQIEMRFVFFCRCLNPVINRSLIETMPYNVFFSWRKSSSVNNTRIHISNWYCVLHKRIKLNNGLIGHTTFFTHTPCHWNLFFLPSICADF